MSKIIQEAKKLIESYYGQGWEAQSFKYVHCNEAAIVEMIHKNGNKMKLNIDFHSQTISVYINNRLKDQTKIK